MNRHVVRDLPDELRAAYGEFLHGAVLVVNVALRQWRFLERLGFSGAHWFGGFGWFANVVPPMKVGSADPPFHPDRPIMLTSYVPFLSPGLPAAAQCSVGRARLLAAPYREFERAMRAQLQQMFGRYGFNARRDVRALITNRWGHAYICAQPGFFFGRNGRPAARDVIRGGYGRVRFAHAELQGNQSILSCAAEAERAIGQIVQLL
jgi:spermidine dehydrogenase